MTSEMWEPLALALLQAGYTVLRYDMFGHGRSSCDPAITYGLQTFSKQLDEVLRCTCTFSA